MTERGMVQIAFNSLVKGVRVPLFVRCALRRGVWAVTPLLLMDGTPVDGVWRVTHVPSGLTVCEPVTLKRARQLCRRLHAALPDFGARARFGVVPRKMTSERWQKAHDVVAEWRRDWGDG